ncbi:hypothetical protein P4284_16840 [Bacillus swezeyi]|nr:hypothetical protein [Bacillus swezeyi]MED2943451.1 hypothetical protein [Bacillus swezeyi]MED2978357.1 hypothetical protein [Bacillus swezeyi]MED3070930.1 hypothetical protein [Bacillus swezeyi]
MCRLCKGRQSVQQDAGFGVVFSACPNCRGKSGDLTETIKDLEALILKMKARVKQGA